MLKSNDTGNFNHDQKFEEHGLIEYMLFLAAVGLALPGIIYFALSLMDVLNK